MSLISNIAEKIGIAEPKVWFITGAATGLGYALVEAVLAKGDRALAAARNAEQRLANLTSRYPEQCRAVELDTTNKAQVEAAAQIATNAFGRIDVLVNNAGNTAAGALEEFSDEEIRSLFETNMFGTINVLRAFLPVLREQKSGHILNVSSLAGHSGYMGNATYAATKFGIEGLSESLAQEVESLGIKLTIIEPATYQTNIVNRMTRANQINDYNHVHEFLETAEANGGSDDLEGYARALIKVVESSNPPLRLTVGSGGAKLLYDKIEGELKERDQWESVSGYTDAT